MLKPPDKRGHAVDKDLIDLMKLRRLPRGSRVVSQNLAICLRADERELLALRTAVINATSDVRRQHRSLDLEDFVGRAEGVAPRDAAVLFRNLSVSTSFLLD